MCHKDRWFKSWEMPLERFPRKRDRQGEKGWGGGTFFRSVNYRLQVGELKL
jgi:hypothetical protein